MEKGRVDWRVWMGALLLLLAGLWLLFEASDSRAEKSTHGHPGPSSQSRELTSELPPVAAPERALVASAESAEDAIEEEPKIDDPRIDWLRGIVVNAQDAPISGATVALVRTPSSDNTFEFQRDPDFQAHLERAAEARSGPDGRFAFQLARGIPFDLAAEAPGHAAGFLPFVQAGQDVRVTLGVEHAVHGRLTREVDGKPVADALVRVFTWPSCAARTSRSASDGSYRVAFPFEGSLFIEVLPIQEGSTGWVRFELDPDGQAKLNFELPSGVPVVGLVTEVPSGRALAGAIIGEGHQFRRTAVTDAQGRYRLEGVGGPGAYGLSAKAKGHGMAKRMKLPSVVDGAIHVDFELPLAGSASGRVVDGAGTPVENAWIAASAWFQDENGQRTSHSSCRSDRDGRFRLEDLSPGLGRHGFTVSAPGLARHHGWIPQPAVENEESLLGEIVLRAPALVTGRVLAADGRVLAEAEVNVRSADDWRSTWTDALGRFAFGDLEPGHYTLAANWYAREAKPKFELTLAEGEIREGLELRVPRGETLSGRVVDERGLGIGGVQVTAQLDEARHSDEKPEEPLYFYEKTDESGAFCFEDILAGEYFVLAAPRGPRFEDVHWEDAHGQGSTGAAPIELVLLKNGDRIRGRLLDAAGAPLVNYSVAGRRAEGGWTGAGTDANGRFELWVPSRTRWDLVVSGPAQGGDSEKELLIQRGVDAGAQDVELRLPPR